MGRVPCQCRLECIFPIKTIFGCSLGVVNVGCCGFGCSGNWMLWSWMLWYSPFESWVEYNRFTDKTFELWVESIKGPSRLEKLWMCGCVDVFRWIIKKMKDGNRKLGKNHSETTSVIFNLRSKLRSPEDKFDQNGFSTIRSLVFVLKDRTTIMTLSCLSRQNASNHV